MSWKKKATLFDIIMRETQGFINLCKGKTVYLQHGPCPELLGFDPKTSVLKNDSKIRNFLDKKYEL
jgi:hypothetical protein